MIGIDVGRDRVKVSAPGREFSFPSRVGEWRELRLGSYGDYVVETDGQRYFVGDMARESRFERQMATESKSTEETKILFLTALALAGPGQIVTGIPVDQHREGPKKELQALLEGIHGITVGGIRRTCIVNNLGIVAEGAGAYWDMMLDDNGEIVNPLAERLVRVIEIGSRTINYLTIDRRRYLDRDSGTLPYGCFELQGSSEREQFARRIVADLSHRWPNPGFVLLAGGGAILLGDALRKHFPASQIHPNPLWANARGFRKMGVRRCANLSTSAS